jgi:hypothetical protein
MHAKLPCSPSSFHHDKACRLSLSADMTSTARPRSLGVQVADPATVFGIWPLAPTTLRSTLGSWCLRWLRTSEMRILLMAAKHGPMSYSSSQTGPTNFTFVGRRGGAYLSPYQIRSRPCARSHAPRSPRTEPKRFSYLYSYAVLYGLLERVCYEA